MYVFPLTILNEIKRQTPLFSSSSPISKIASECFCEIAVSLTTGSIVCLFNAHPFGLALIVHSLALEIIMNTTTRCVRESMKSDQDSLRNKKIDWIANRICAISFAFRTMRLLETLIHELGHALAATNLYKNARVFIEIYPFEGGTTSYSISHLNSLGCIIGKTQARFFTTISGPLLSLVFSSILLKASTQIKKDTPQLSYYLESSALMNFYTNANYAFSALKAPLELSHDFVYLSAVGIHPLVATIIIIAIPIFILKTGSMNT